MQLIAFLPELSEANGYKQQSDCLNIADVAIGVRMCPLPHNMICAKGPTRVKIIIIKGTCEGEICHQPNGGNFDLQDASRTTDKRRFWPIDGYSVTVSGRDVVKRVRC